MLDLKFRQVTRIYFTEIDGEVILLLGGSGKGDQSQKIKKLASALRTSINGLTEKTMTTSKALNIKKELYEDLKDPAYASAYINEAMLDGDEAVLKTALADLIRARGVTAVARKAGINRVTVYKTLKPETESSFTTMHALLSACNVQLHVKPGRATNKRA